MTYALVLTGVTALQEIALLDLAFGPAAISAPLPLELLRGQEKHHPDPCRLDTPAAHTAHGSSGATPPCSLVRRAAGCMAQRRDRPHWPHPRALRHRHAAADSLRLQLPRGRSESDTR